ncbi:MAG: NAD(+)/NADH kinase [Gammaproteobacteria bacterium]|nr:NAD(+)/NADH kinase [Gammaproteobacteria bacterium]
MPSFKNILFVLNTGDQNSVDSLKVILQKNFSHDVSVKIFDSSYSNNITEIDLIKVINESEIHQCDLIISIGGDGTMLKSAKLSHQHQIPVTGINKGRLGFLTDINPSAANKTINNLISGKFITEDRLLIETIINKDGIKNSIGIALNDVAIRRKETGRMMKVTTSIDGNYINQHEGDGFIVSTPTGSTAYSLSCGGPILKPDVEAFILVPICPHSLNDRPMVIPSNSEILIEPILNTGEIAEIALDGDSSYEIKQGETIIINATKTPIKLIHPEDYDYFDVLRSKLLWGSNKKKN